MDPRKLAKIRQIVAGHVPFQSRDGRVFLGTDDATPRGTAGRGLIGRLKNALKRYGPLYAFLTAAFTSVRLSRAFRRELDQALERHGAESVILNIGSGPTRLGNRSDVINVDIFAFEEVDVCVVPGPLPFQDDAVDCVLSVATLEHIPDPAATVAELRRVLKPGGEALLYIPFMQPFHAAPSDFQRWTEEGCKVLCSGFSHVATGIGAGPTSGFLWTACEWLALLLSCGNATAHSLLGLFFMVATSPLKFLDCLLERHPNAGGIASAFYVLARK